MIKDKSIFIKNIYYMLSYAFTTLNQGGYEDVATEEFENMHNLFAAILAKGISRQLKQGLYREYLNRKEDVAVVRGKIDMPGTIQNRIARKRVLTCEYDELSENNLYASAQAHESGSGVQERSEKGNAVLLEC
jgi:5-methylcytosine-specific restriction enzyme subunit McrC